MTIVDISNAIQSAMRAAGINGRYDVRWEGSRSTGYVGKPSGDDVELVVNATPLGPLEEKP